MITRRTARKNIAVVSYDPGTLVDKQKEVTTKDMTPMDMSKNTFEICDREFAFSDLMAFFKSSDSKDTTNRQDIEEDNLSGHNAAKMDNCSDNEHDPISRATENTNGKSAIKIIGKYSEIVKFLENLYKQKKDYYDLATDLSLPNKPVDNKNEITDVINVFTDSSKMNNVDHFQPQTGTKLKFHKPVSNEFNFFYIRDYWERKCTK